eukprot:CAMPEP_0204529952 /NCGR_PEP_ID=MMETSP0661-20131031/10348_1 /ASSEMBLY_ACC=CAM_ASM_000606 /TAXON_ID=109239 /ORGANISM="Alexandrium margalefi, Strain AMGDE01CS-322" /LENGTH=213 /DNA_ID=CAMNT_0051536007 /DNA_START=45 /DNA_END=682 /DNA_ORIENTATION=-
MCSQMDIGEQARAQVGDATKRKRNLIDVPAGVTTLMVRNVARGYSQEELMKVWPHVDCYDFLHLPRAHNRGRTTTYAFLNCVSHEKALEFTHRWHGYFLPHHSAPKSLSIAVARSQGLAGNLGLSSWQELDVTARHDVLPMTFINNIAIDCRAVYLALDLGGDSGDGASCGDSEAAEDSEGSTRCSMQSSTGSLAEAARPIGAAMAAASAMQR